jgi:predicted transcriptional regulator
MKRRPVLKAAEAELGASGYATVLAGNIRTCADIFAQRKGDKLVVKVVHNIDSISEAEASALFRLSRFLNAEPLIVGAVSCNGRLRHGISYDRFFVRCVSAATLPHLSESLCYPASKAFGVKVRISSARLRALRKLGNLTVTELARRTGISKHTLYKHERADGYASIATVSRLERVLSEPIRAESPAENRGGPLRTGTLAKTGIRSITLNGAPFDMVARSKNYYEIGLEANARTLAKRAALFRLMRENFEGNYPFFISSGRRSIGGVPAMKRKELMALASEEDLLNAVY